MSDIGIIIRLWHNNIEDQQWRFFYFASCVLPRLQAQTVSDFDICILSPYEYHKPLEKLDSRIKPFVLNTDGFEYKYQGNFDYSDTVGLKRYKTAIRLDSDDLVSPDFIEIIQNTAGNVSFQPELFLLDELRVKKMNHIYRNDKPSMFLALKDYDKCIYHQVFLRFNATLIPEGVCYMTVHDRNRSTRKTS